MREFFKKLNLKYNYNFTINFIYITISYILLVSIVISNYSGKNLDEINNLLIKYYDYSIIISVSVLIIFAITIFFKSKEDKNNYLINIVQPIIQTQLFLSTLYYFTQCQIELISLTSFFIFLVYTILIFILCSIDYELTVVDEKYDKLSIDVENNYFHPINNYDMLFNSQKNIAENIIKSIDSNEVNSICLSGKWGSGKTSIINCVINSMNTKNNSINIHEIRINALELDTLESLHRYFFSRIKQILKSKNVYVGFFSDYQKLIRTSLGVIIGSNLADFLSLFFQNNNDYRELKEKVNNTLEIALEEEKIIIVIDDIERCEEDKIKEYLFFIKEIATMNKCIAIFLTDMEILETIAVKFIDNKDSKDKSLNKSKFLDKFFNVTLSISKIETVNCFEYLDKKYKCQSNFKYTSLSSYVELMKNLNGFIEKTKSEDKKNNKNNYNTLISQINEYLSDYRTIIKIFNKYLYYLKKVHDYALKDKNNLHHLEKINAIQVIFIISIVHSVNYAEFNVLQNKGVNGYFEEVEDSSFNVIFKSLLYILTNETNDYMQNKVYEFIDIVLNEEEQIEVSYNNFNDKKEEYIDLLKNASANENTINEKFDDITNTLRENFIEGALNVYIGSFIEIIDPSNISKLFANKFKVDIIASNTYWMKEIYVNNKFDLVKRDNHFNHIFLVRRLKEIILFLKFNENYNISNYSESGKSKPYIKIYTYEEFHVHIFKNYLNDELKCCLKETILETIKYLKSEDKYKDFPDVKNMIKQIEFIIEDVEYYFKIENNYKIENNVEYISDIDNNSIAISELHNIVNNLNSSKESEIWSFFSKDNLNKRDFTVNEIEDLHKILTELYNNEFYKYNFEYLRFNLIQYQRKNENNEEQNENI